MNITVFTRQFLVGSFLFLGFLVVSSMNVANKKNMANEKIEKSQEQVQEIIAAK